MDLMKQTENNKAIHQVFFQYFETVSLYQTYFCFSLCQLKQLSPEIQSYDNNGPYIDHDIQKESTLVISEKEVNKSALENNLDKPNIEMVSIKLDENSPLKPFIDNFKQKYNISVEPNDIAIFVQGI